MDHEIEKIKLLNPNETEFHQATEELLHTVKPLLDSNSVYRKSSIIERITEPDRQIKFKVTWMGDDGKINVNRGYRVQFNNCLGPYKGGLRFHPSVNMSIIKFLAFEQIFKNALTSLPIGGAKGGSDFDPKGKSDREIMNFCQSFMTELIRYIGPDRDIPAGDIGVGEREIGYLFGQYKRLKNLYEGSITGKGLCFGGSLGRKQATGYGLMYITEEMLNKNKHDINGKTVCISGSGNVAIYTAEKAISMGCKVLTMSDSSGWIYDENGIDISVVKQIKEVNRERLKQYVNLKSSAVYHEGKFLWDVPCDLALPCATQNEIDCKCMENIIKNKTIAVAEGANMPILSDALKLIENSSVLYLSGKAANAGGVAVSALEMSQNSMRLKWEMNEVDRKLKTIMQNIFKKVSLTCERYNMQKNYAAGANIAGFKLVADSMLAQGMV